MFYYIKIHVCLHHNFYSAIPSLHAMLFHPRMPNISYSQKTKRLAVGARSGQVGIYDLKQGRTQVRPCDHHVIVT